jgi:hypothetical protein
MAGCGIFVCGFFHFFSLGLFVRRTGDNSSYLDLRPLKKERQALKSKWLTTFRQCWGIRIRRIHMFLAFTDPDPLVRDTDRDPSSIMQK